MFEQSFIDEPGRGIRAWTIAASFLLQVLVLAATVLLPLLFTYDPPMDWVRNALLLAPPPPPQPPPPAAAAAPKAPPPQRFESSLKAPVAFPDQVALFHDGKLDGLNSLQAPNIGVHGGIPGGVINGVLGVTAAMQPPERPLMVGGNVQAAKIISRVSPVYPPEAIEQGISGAVYLQAIITKEGIIREIKVISGDPALASCALEAVRQWRYRPTFLNGNPVEVLTQIEVKFQLREEPPPDDGKDKGKRRKKK